MTIINIYLGEITVQSYAIFNISMNQKYKRSCIKLSWGDSNPLGTRRICLQIELSWAFVFLDSSFTLPSCGQIEVDIEGMEVKGPQELVMSCLLES